MDNPLESRRGARVVRALTIEGWDHEAKAPVNAEVPFYAFPEQGCWFGMHGGALLTVYMEKGGEPEMDGALANAGEVDFDRIDEDVARDCYAAECEILRGLLSSVTAALENAVLHQGPQMTEADRIGRGKLATSAREAIGAS